MNSRSGREFRWAVKYFALEKFSRFIDGDELLSRSPSWSRNKAPLNGSDIMPSGKTFGWLAGPRGNRSRSSSKTRSTSLTERRTCREYTSAKARTRLSVASMASRRDRSRSTNRCAHPSPASTSPPTGQSRIDQNLPLTYARQLEAPALRTRHM